MYPDYGGCFLWFDPACAVIADDDISDAKRACSVPPTVDIQYPSIIAILLLVNDDAFEATGVSSLDNPSLIVLDVAVDVYSDLNCSDPAAPLANAIDHLDPVVVAAAVYLIKNLNQYIPASTGNDKPVTFCIVFAVELLLTTSDVKTSTAILDDVVLAPLNNDTFCDPIS